MLEKYPRPVIRGKQGNGKTVDYDINFEHVNYLLKPDEQFARAYTQYVASRSRNSDLRGPIAAEAQLPTTTNLGGMRPDTLHYHEQWQADDFAKISEAFDKLFEHKRWII